MKRFGLLRQFTLADSHHRHHTVQTRTLHRYLRRRNLDAGSPRQDGRPATRTRLQREGPVHRTGPHQGPSGTSVARTRDNVGGSIRSTNVFKSDHATQAYA